MIEEDFKKLMDLTLPSFAPYNGTKEGHKSWIPISQIFKHNIKIKIALDTIENILNYLAYPKKIKMKYRWEYPPKIYNITIKEIDINYIKKFLNILYETEKKMKKVIEEDICEKEK